MGKRSWEPTIVGETAEIPLTRGYVAVIDLEDLDLVRPLTWIASVSKWTTYGRATGRGGKSEILMHRLICFGIGETDPRYIDHIDRNGLNNRRSNLRPCSQSENMYNRRPLPGTTSRFVGVHLHRTGKWMARITIDGERLYLGVHASEEDAARAVDAVAIERRGEFALLNFPEG